MWERRLLELTGPRSAEDVLVARWKLRIYLLPRHKDLPKLLPTLFAFAVLCLIGEESVRPAVVCVVFIVIFEIIVYQARYLWNDLLGAGEDARRHDSAARDRVPFLRHPQLVRSAVCSLFFRALISVVIIWVPGLIPAFSMLDKLVLWSAIVMVTVVSFTYEKIRDRWRRDWVAVHRWSRNGFWVASLLILPGYLIRGVYAAYIGGASLVQVIACSLAIGLYGTMFVLCAWVLEGLSATTPDGSVDRRALCQKPHTRYAAYQAGALDRNGDRSEAFTKVLNGSSVDPRPPSQIRALSAGVRLPVSILSRSWLIIELLAIASAAVLPALSIGRRYGTEAGITAWLAACLLGAAVVLSTECTANRGVRLAVHTLAVVVVVTTFFVLTLDVSIAMTLVVFLAIGYGTITSQNYAEVASGFLAAIAAAREQLTEKIEGMFRFVFGDFAARQLFSTPRSKPPAHDVPAQAPADSSAGSAAGIR